MQKLRSSALLAAAVLVARAATASPVPAPALPDAELKTVVDQRVRALQPSASDRRFDEIGWAREIVTAQRLARESKRPVFLFTHDGRMNLGRC
jgi:hypothetical protein